MRTVALSSVFASAALALACSGEPLAPVTAEPALEASYAAMPANACWGQASKVFARMGLMGEHSANQPTPRLGLANLARVLYDMGVISEPTMTALGRFVADALGLSIDACM